MILSVVVPTLDERDCLPVLLDSVRASSERAGATVECIVADGGSADGTPEVAREAGATVVSAPRGRGVQLHAGATRATGDVLVFLHADTRLDVGALAAIARAFEREELVAAGLRQRIRGDRRVYRWIERAADARVRRGMVYGDSGLCVRRAAYDAVGGFAPHPIFEDVDLSRRLRARGEVALVDGALLEISPRRWERDGPIRRTACNWALTVAFLAGVPPARLARFYRPDAGTRAAVPRDA